MGVLQVRKVRVESAAVLLVVSLVAARVDAQPGASASKAAEPAKPGSKEAAKKLVADGIAAQEAHEYGRAVGLYLKAFSLNPHPLLLFDVAQAYRLAGCFERAGLFYERYLALEPKGTQSEPSRAALAGIKQRGGKPDDASCASTADAVDTVDHAPAEAVPAMGRLKLDSEPSGVVVMLDGNKIGVTPVERELPAGAHTITLVDGETLVGERKVEISANETADLTVTVERPWRVPQPQGASRVAPMLAWTGGGLALMSSGFAFYYGQKGGADHPDDKYRYPGATAAGVVLAGAGVAAIGVGVWLWRRESREPAPVAVVGPSGGYIGWQGRF